MSSRVRISVIAAVAIAALAIVTFLVMNRLGDQGQLTEKGVSGAVDDNTLESATSTRIFFAHQSVGGNVVDGIPMAYEAKGLDVPEIIEITGDASPAVPDGGFFAHSFIGENGDPEGKLQAFDTLMRSGFAEQVDVAMLKFCYIDVTAATDVENLFAEYQRTLSALERDFPDVTFLHVTTPLNTPPGIKTRVKSMLGRGNPVAADNAARERLNELLRDAYDKSQLFDLAAFESTAPDGSRVSGSYEGETYYSLYEGYSIDTGHLDPLASQLAASELLTFIDSTSA